MARAAAELHIPSKADVDAGDVVVKAADPCTACGGSGEQGDSGFECYLCDGSGDGAEERLSRRLGLTNDNVEQGHVGIDLSAAEIVQECSSPAVAADLVGDLYDPSEYRAIGRWIVVKASGVDPQLAAEVRAWLEQHLTPDTTSIEEVLRKLYSEAGSVGSAVAVELLPGDPVSAPGAGTVDWSTWLPGNPSASELAELLPQRLSDLELTIKGITDTQLDLIAGRLTDGLWAGSNMSTIAQAIDGVLGTEDRGMVIARTETCRAVEEASQRAYTENGIKEWEWMVGEDACPDCDPFDGQTFPIGSDEPSIPYHPNCRCSSAPVVETGATEDDLEDDVAG